jgi:hypothetical protein
MKHHPRPRRARTVRRYGTIRDIDPTLLQADEISSKKPRATKQDSPTWLSAAQTRWRANADRAAQGVRAHLRRHWIYPGRGGLRATQVPFPGILRGLFRSAVGDRNPRGAVRFPRGGALATSGTAGGAPIQPSNALLVVFAISHDRRIMPTTAVSSANLPPADRIA